MTQQQIEVILRRKLFQKFFTVSLLTKVFKTLEPTIIKLIIQRTQEGVDFYGRNFGNYNETSRKSKSGKITRGLYDKVKAQKYAAQKSGLTKYASTSSDKKIQLTGNTFSAMECKLEKVNVGTMQATGRFRIFVNNVSGRNEQKLVEGLQSTTGTARNGKTYSKKAWYFLGLSYAGSKVNEEKTTLINQLVKGFQTNYQTTVKVK